MTAPLLRRAVSIALLSVSFTAAAQKTPVKTEADLPRALYPLKQPASVLLAQRSAQFRPFAVRVQRDLNSVLDRYDIQDRATLRELLAAKLDLQDLAGDWQGGLKTIDALRALEEKPAAKLISGLYARARFKAALATGHAQGPRYLAAFKKFYAQSLEPLPFDVIADSVRQGYSSARLASRALIIGDAQTHLDPAVLRSHSVDNQQAYELVNLKVGLERAIPTSAARADVLQQLLQAHPNKKQDIWAQRELTLTPDQQLTPVAVAIWDSGIDLDLFPNQTFTDTQPTASGTHGLAFTDEGLSSTDWLHPLSATEKAAYPEFLNEIQGRLDIGDGVQSPEAIALEHQMQTLSVDQMHARQENAMKLGFYVHGTHCAGIATRGNPYARLVVARFNDELPYLPFAPTEQWALQLEKDFAQMGEYFNTRHVRVVNMSWGDDVREFEMWLSRTGAGGDAASRKALAGQLFAIWRRAVEKAIASAPDTLFVTAAGNSDSDAGFLGDVPASLHLPNLIAVGAVNQAGDETSFTSSGDTVLLHANGYQVDSVVPGGRHERLSGTSMASPNVVNLAAKLFALNPSLSPAQVIDLMRRGADASDDGRRHLINPKRSAALLQPS